MQIQQQKNYTPTEYLNLETNSQQRHEYINGEIIPMTGGTPNHNQIALNFSAALNFSLKRQPYRVFCCRPTTLDSEKMHLYLS